MDNVHWFSKWVKPQPVIIPGAITRIYMGNAEFSIYPIGYRHGGS